MAARSRVFGVLKTFRTHKIVRSPHEFLDIHGSPRESTVSVTALPGNYPVRQLPGIHAGPGTHKFNTREIVRRLYPLAALASHSLVLARQLGTGNT